MTRKNNRRGPAALISELRETLRRSMTKQLDDPRVTQREDLSPAQKRKANEKSPAVAEARRLIAAIDRGDTVCVPRWYADGNHHPEGRAIPWLQSVSMILVDADDTVHPA